MIKCSYICNFSRFFEIAGFPGCIGAIDCTHIPISNPGGVDSEVYRNRKQRFSINCQAIAGPENQFLSTTVMWPGSVHDARIFANSNIKNIIEHFPGHLIGDSAYPCRQYLMIPITNPTTNPEMQFNKSLSSTRMKIECAFGILKRRFACLDKKLATKLETSIAIIVSCFVLHNYAIKHRDNWEYINDEPIAEILEVQGNRPNILGQNKRLSIIRNYFS